MFQKLLIKPLRDSNIVDSSIHVQIPFTHTKICRHAYNEHSEMLTIIGILEQYIYFTINFEFFPCP